MFPRTETTPKAMLPVLGVPFVDLQLRWLAEQGVREVLYSIGHLGSSISAHVGDGSQVGLRVRYVDEGEDLRGTAGALRLALDLGLLPEAFMVLYGDSYLTLDLSAVEQAWKQSGLPALMTVLRNEDLWDQSNVVYDDGLVSLYDKSRPEQHRAVMRWIDYGLCMLRAGVVRDRVPSGAVLDLAEVLRGLSYDGLLAGFEVKERFYEIGSPSGLRDLEVHLAGGDSSV